MRRQGWIPAFAGMTMRKRGSSRDASAEAVRADIRVQGWNPACAEMTGRAIRRRCRAASEGSNRTVN
jgi:hypothetical protein